MIPAAFLALGIILGYGFCVWTYRKHAWGTLPSLNARANLYNDSAHDQWKRAPDDPGAPNVRL